MKELVYSLEEKCQGCNRCLRVCPVEEANVAYAENGKIKVRIDSGKCIACGACINVCQHGARDYRDDTERFLQDLAAGRAVSLFVAPASRTNFRDFDGLLLWLREMGVNKIYDVSIGADICTWAHIRYIQKHSPGPIITQPCPAIVNYVTKYRTELAGNLSPVHSPMLCTAVFMKKYMDVTDRIAALSPCIAKSSEFESTALADYNVTFKRLQDYMESHRIQLPAGRFEFDHIESSLGRIYPMPGGLKENLEYYLGKSIRVDKSEGQSVVYHALDEYARQRKEDLPAVFDVLNCPEGCNLGTGCSHDASVFEINGAMDAQRQKAMGLYRKTDEAAMTELFRKFDARLNLDDFVRTYRTQPVRAKHISEPEIERAYEALEKFSAEDRQHNCYACGSATCREMAVKIAKGINIPDNCIEKNRRSVQREHDALQREQKANATTIVRLTQEINGIKRLSDDVLEAMRQINEAMEGYEQMATMINSIAMETNLLALNASIEAARAGNAGSSFAVVAQAIRKLAENSQRSVDSTVNAGRFATESIRSVNDSSLRVNDSLKKVSGSLREIAASMDVS